MFWPGLTGQYYHKRTFRRDRARPVPDSRDTLLCVSITIFRDFPIETRRYARLYRLSVGLYGRRAVQARLYNGLLLKKPVIFSNFPIFTK